MQIIIHGKHIAVTEALKQYVEHKLRRLDTLAAASEAVVTIAVGGHKHEHKVEVTLRLDGAVIRAEERTDDMYTSIDKVADKLERKLRKLKEKLRRRLRRGTGRAEEGMMAADAELGEEQAPFEIGRVKRLELKPVDVEDAILEMNLLDHQFHVFINRKTQATEVVYRRLDGTYGLITA
ncbi:ribosome hibernation-promoting factor, HPF/YfiA family [Paenibacillus chartarius]|uniref:Ribosome hibernation promoting factor n=1 Tax=Paenibacillus chartarius TaxID=747481 RepID=A0ABV6DHT2_9BACL